jgi:hypothetical protein
LQKELPDKRACDGSGDIPVADSMPFSKSKDFTAPERCRRQECRRSYMRAAPHLPHSRTENYFYPMLKQNRSPLPADTLHLRKLRRVLTVLPLHCVLHRLKLHLQTIVPVAKNRKPLALFRSGFTAAGFTNL